MAPTIAEIMSRIPSAFQREKAGGMSAVVHFKITGEQAGEWNASIADGSCTVAQGLPRNRPTITIAADSDDFRAIASGQMDATNAAMLGRVKVTGDIQSAMHLMELFRVP
jgi:putative sterol carrier protein